MKSLKNTMVIVLSILLFFLSACSNHVDKLEHRVSEASINGNGRITIYIQEHDRVIKEAINIYRVRNPQIEIDELIVYDYDEYNTKLYTELMAGNGPDIFSFNIGTFNSLNKMVSSGVFYDLEPLIVPEMVSNFNTIVFDCGIIDNKRFFIPTSYFINTLWTLEGVVGQNTTSWEQFVVDLKNYRIHNNINLDNGYLFSGTFSAYYYLLNSGLELINYQKKEAYFYTEECTRAINKYKEIYNMYCPNDRLIKYKLGDYDMIKEGSIFASFNAALLNPNNLWLSNSIVNQSMNLKMDIFAPPSFNSSGKYSAEPASLIAVNSKCMDIKCAFDFVKFILSKEIQKIKDMQGIPVNNEAITELLEKFENNDIEKEYKIINTNYGQIHTIPLPNKLGHKAETIINNINSCQINDKDIILIIENDIQDFIDGKCTAKQAAENIQRKVMLILNE